MEEPKVIIEVSFKGIDDWNRPVYKLVRGNVYFGSTNILFPDKNIAPNNTEEEINEYFKNNIEQIEYFGNSFNCEPHGGMPSKYQLSIISNKEVKERRELLLKNVEKLEVHKYAPELNKLWMKNGVTYNMHNIDTIEKACNALINTFSWENIKVNLK